MTPSLSTGTLQRLSQRRVVGITSPSPETSQDAEQRRREQIFMEDVRDRFRICAAAEDRQRQEMLEDLRFKCGEQWRESDIAVRTQQGRPCLTINRIPGFISHVVNNMRQNRPEPRIDPIADGADEEIAEVRQGLIRHIGAMSNAETARDNAFEHLCTMGLGYTRVVDVWDDPRSFDMGLRVEWVRNPFTVYHDPAAAKADWSDSRYWFIVEDISWLEFKRRFGTQYTPASLSEFKTLGDDAPYWLIGEKVRVAEYFHIEDEPDTLWELPEGTTAYESELDPTVLMQLEEARARNRQVKKPVVWWSLLYGMGILRQRRWKGQYIPIIPYIGNQTEVAGEMVIVGMVRYAKEAQRMFNYMYSSFVEACALAPRAPFVAEYDQISEFEQIWKNANQNPVAYLPYKGKTIDGQLLPAPQRQQAEPPIQAFVAGLRLADDNMKSTFRIFDASLGQRGPQESGVAIASRKIESDLSTYDWHDNFARGLRYEALVLNDLLQYYYNDPGREIQILQEDLTKRRVVMNAQPDGQTSQDSVYDLSKGKFSVSVSTGPAFATRRQEASKAMLDLVKFYPAIMQIAGPDVIREMDWPRKDAIAAQLEKAMPPALRGADPNAPKEDPEQLKEMLAKLMEQNQVMSKLLNEAMDKHSQEREKEQWETFRAQMQNETQLAMAQLKVGSQEAKDLNERIFQELERVMAKLEPETVDKAAGPQDQGGAAQVAAPEGQGAPTAAPPASVPTPPPAGGAGSTPAEVGIGT